MPQYQGHNHMGMPIPQMNMAIGMPQVVQPGHTGFYAPTQHQQVEEGQGPAKAVQWGGGGGREDIPAVTAMIRSSDCILHSS